MKIKLKFKLEDIVYFIHNSTILEGEIKSIHIHNLKEDNEIKEYEVRVYLPKITHTFSLIEDEMFKDKKSLLKSVKKKLKKL